MSYEVQIKKSPKHPGFYEARYKVVGAKHSGPLAVAKTRETLAGIATRAGMTVVQKWS